jgi:ABC-type sulfate transport system substrate-binding protein
MTKDEFDAEKAIVVYYQARANLLAGRLLNEVAAQRDRLQDAVAMLNREALEQRARSYERSADRREAEAEVERVHESQMKQWQRATAELQAEVVRLRAIVDVLRGEGEK